jgi:hypothetical protein
MAPYLGKLLVITCSIEFCDCFVKIRQQLISNKEELEEYIIKLQQ